MKALQPARPRPVRAIKHRYAFDATMMALYTIVVYSCAIAVHPLGRDYAFLDSPAKLPLVASQLFAREIMLFGGNPIGYHLVNAALLYACMLCLYHLTRLVLGGPVWYGTLAATLFMSNPVHTESVLNLSGPGDLIPALAALAALALYAAARRGERRRPALIALSWIAFAWAILPYRENAGLIGVVALFEGLVAAKDRRRWVAMIPCAAMTAVAWAGYWEDFHVSGWDLAQQIVPVYFLFYPLGFLPATVALFHEQPWLAWLSAASVAGLLALIYRKARRAGLVFGLFGMLAVVVGRACFLPGGVDPVHLIGGGQLLVANALFNIAAAALFMRMTEHPKWRQPVVFWTTILCLTLFALQVRANLAWRHAGDQVQAFQEQAAAFCAAHPGETVGLLPDYRYYRGAPLCYAEAAAYGTVFSTRLPLMPLLPLHQPATQGLDVRITEETTDAITVLVTGARPLEFLPDYRAPRSARIFFENAHVACEVRASDSNAMTVLIQSKTGAPPDHTFPAGPEGALRSREESGDNS